MATNFAQLIAQQGLANTAPANAPDAVGAWSQAAQVANQREQLAQAKLKNQQDMKIAQGAKMEKFVDALQKGANYQGAARTNYYNKWLPTYRDSLGLTEAFPDEALKFATMTPENMARVNTLTARVRDPNDPLTEAEAIAILQDPTKFADIPPEVFTETTNQLAEAAKTKIGAQAQIASRQQQEDQFQRGQTATEERSFKSFVTQLGTRVRSEFKPIEDNKASVKNAYDSLNKVQADIRAGKKPSSIEFNTAARGLAKAFNSGAMTDQDVADFKNLTGIANITEDAVNKWITGNVNTQAVASLLNVARRTATNLDSRANRLAESFSDQFATYPDRAAEVRQRSGLSRFLQPTLPTDTKRNIDDLNPNQARFLIQKIESNAELAQKASADYGLAVEDLVASLRRKAGI